MNKVWTLLGSFGFFSCLGWSSSQQAMEDLLSSAVRAPRPDGARLLKRAHLSNQDNTAGSEDLLAGQAKKGFWGRMLVKERNFLEQTKKAKDRNDYLAAIDRELFLMVEVDADAFCLLQDLNDNYKAPSLDIEKRIEDLVKVVPNKQVAHDWAYTIGHNYIYAYGCRHEKIPLWDAIEIALRPKGA